jgi:transcriptional regulator with XRE-family HTH domain
VHVELNVQALREHSHQVGVDPGRSLNRQLADRLRVSEPTISRVMRGKTEPGNRVIAAFLLHFGPGNFHHIFRVVSD